MKKHSVKICSLLLSAALTAGLAAPAGAVSPTYNVTGAYASSSYYQKLGSLQLTGNYRADLVNVALTQVGYHEGAGRRDRDGMNMTSDGNYTEYGYFSDCDGYAWCAMFISWCARQARIPTGVIANSRVARAPYFGVKFRAKGEYTPIPGDIIFFAEEGEEWSHVGIVMSVRDGYIFTVEGNSRDMVRVMRYKPDDDYIKGYGVYSSSACDPSLIKSGNIYAVNYDLNGGEGKRRSQYITAGATLGLYKNAPEERESDEELAEEVDNKHWTWKTGCSFEGWYVKRDEDGFWLTEKNGFMSEADIISRKLRRKVYEDNASVVIDGSWSKNDNASFTFYAVWKNDASGKTEDTTAYVVSYDSEGWANVFADIKEGDINYDAVREMVKRGYVNGVSEHRFGTESKLTRAQFLMLLYRVDGGKAVESTVLPYSDIKADDWFAEAVTWAYNAGLAPAGGSLSPNAGISREEAVKYLYSYAVYTGAAEAVSDKDITLDTLRSLFAYNDIGTVSLSSIEAIIWAHNSGLLKACGFEGRDSLSPKTVLGRAEGCGMLGSFLNGGNM